MICVTGIGLYFLLILGFQSACSNLVKSRKEGKVHTEDTSKGFSGTDRLRELRSAMQDAKLDALIITSDDEHQSEYVAESDKRREYITGFTGSAGTAVVLKSKAAMWTDSRYYIQAEQELDNNNWKLMTGVDSSIAHWLQSELPNGSRVGADPKLITQVQWMQWSELLHEHLITLSETDKNLVDVVWNKDSRPQQNNSKIVIQDLKFAGETWQQKIERIRRDMESNAIDVLIVTSLVEVAWLFNLRGSDIPYVPVFKAFAVLTQDKAKLYVDKQKLTTNVSQHLTTQNCSGISCVQVTILDYGDIYEDIQNFVGKNVLVPESVSSAIFNVLQKGYVTLGMTPTLEQMVAKNVVETRGMRAAMLRDSFALTEFFAHLEAEIKRGIVWSELKVSLEIQEFRRRRDYYKGESFEAISAVGRHAAMPHYAPNSKTDLLLDQNQMFLLDSGAQYLDGTTDITRSMHFGTPTDFQKEAYTRVLMGHISLGQLVFPAGTTDLDVDILTRKALYKSGLDYGHGSGHGVGSYLSVHEYPPLIRLPSRPSTGYSFKPGNFFSIEPGYYEEGQFGVRLETIFTVVEYPTEHENGTFFEFQPVVWIPFERDLILVDLMNDEQVKWLDDYHAKCASMLADKLSPVAQAWLKRRTEPIKDWSKSSANHLTVSLLFLVPILGHILILSNVILN